MKVKSLISVVLIAIGLMLVAPSSLAETKCASEPVYMREGPSIKYKLIVELQPGDRVEVLGLSGNWTKVEFEGKTGYVFSKYLTEEIAFIQKVATATANTNIRAGAGTKYKMLGKLKKGSNVLVLFTSGDWARIAYEDLNGFVYLRYLAIQDTHKAVNLAGILSESGYFNNSSELMGTYIDENDRLIIRVARKADIRKIKRDIENLFSNAQGEFLVVTSAMPAYADKSYIDKLLAQMWERENKLTAAQRKQCQVASINYVVDTDQLLVEIVKLDENKKNLFTKWISNWEYITFQTVDSIPKPKV